MTMEHPPFEDVFPTGNGDVPASHVSSPALDVKLPRFKSYSLASQFGKELPNPAMQLGGKPPLLKPVPFECR